MSGAILSLVMGQVAPGISVATPLQMGGIAEHAPRMTTALNRGGMGKTEPLRSLRDDEGKGEAESSRCPQLPVVRYGNRLSVAWVVWHLWHPPGLCRVRDHERIDRLGGRLLD